MRLYWRWHYTTPRSSHPIQPLYNYRSKRSTQTNFELGPILGLGSFVCFKGASPIEWNVEGTRTAEMEKAYKIAHAKLRI